MINQNGTDRTREERVLRAGADGEMGVVQRTVRGESVSPNGDRHQSSETYSLDFPGVPYDGTLHLVERVRSTQHFAKDGRASTETQIEQPDRGSLAWGGMRPTGRTFDVFQPGPAGSSQKTRTIEWLDGGDNLSVVWVRVENSTKSGNH